MGGDDKGPVPDLRAGIELLKRHQGHYVSTDTEVDANLELAGVYRKVGAAGTVKRPTQVGPAMMFSNVKGYDMPVLVGVLASRERTALLLGADTERLGWHMLEAMEHATDPVTIDGQAPCQQVVHRADADGFDIRRLIPAPQSTPEDAGPYLNQAIVRATDPETGKSDVTIHRMCIQGADELSIFFAVGRHIDMIRQKYHAQGKSCPVTISMGVSPVTQMAISFAPPATPYGFDELRFAGGLMRKPIELVKGITVDEYAIADAEIVIEGEVPPDVTMNEDHNTGTGHAMPEFPGYDGPAQPDLHVIKVTAVTTRNNPILQTNIGPGEEHVNLAGIPTEGALLQALELALPGLVTNVYSHPSGGGKYLGVLQIHKRNPNDDALPRQAAITALSTFKEMKHVVVVDDDVDIFDTNDLLWAMTTRFQFERSAIPIPGVTCHPLDPSQNPKFLTTNTAQGVSTKVIFDCTVPWDMKDDFARSAYADVDVTRFLPDWTGP